MTLMSHLTLLPLTLNLDSLLPYPATPPAPTLPARSSPFASSVDETSSAVITLPPNPHAASMTNPPLPGSLTPTTRMIVSPLTILMTSTTTATRTTCKPHPPVYKRVMVIYDE